MILEIVTNIEDRHRRTKDQTKKPNYAKTYIIQKIFLEIKLNWIYISKEM